MGVDVANYSIFMRPDLLQVFWAGIQAGEFITGALLRRIPAPLHACWCSRD
jgi:hypothetical protein